MKKSNLNIKYFSKNISIVLGLVLIWRGIWYILDQIDIWFFGGGHFILAVIGIIIGLAILYIPDHNLDEISNL